jgi:rhamnulokinase
MSKHFAVDLGAESGRCIAGILEDGHLSMHELSRFPTGALVMRDGLYWNVYRFYEEILKGLSKYVEQYGATLDSIGIDTWGVDFGLLDESARLSALPRCYRDPRTENSEHLIFEQLDKKTIYERTGIQFLTFNTLNQLVVSKAENDQQLERTQGLLFIADLLHHMLGAKPCCEYSAASISQLVNIQTRDWDPMILDHFHLPPSLKRPIVFAGDPIGSLSDSLADQAGLQHGVPIIAPAIHDTASAAAAVPGQGGNWGYISSGTWSLAGLELDHPVVNEQTLAQNISNSGGAFNKTLLLKNIMGLWIIQQCRAHWAKIDPTLDYNQIEALAEQSGACSAFIDPDDQLFFGPGHMPVRICEYLQASQGFFCDPNDIGTIAKIVFNSLALKYRLVFDSISRVSGRKLDCLHIVGGGSRNRLLNQLTANAMQMPVLAGPSECTAMGNLLIQAYGCRMFDTQEELRDIVRSSSQIFCFEPEALDIWQKMHQQFTTFIDGVQKKSGT